MNFGYLAAASKWFKQSSILSRIKIDKKDRMSLRINFLKLLITSSFLILLLIWLVKIYEVPVYVTDINIWDSGWMADNCSETHLTVRIGRDYGRYNNFANLKSKSDSVSGQSFDSGISVCGNFYRNPNSVYTVHQLNAPVLDDSIDNMIKRNVELEDYNYFECGYKPVYVSISGTSRQTAYLLRKNFSSSNKYYPPGEYSQEYCGDFTINGGLVTINEIYSEHDFFKSQNVFICSSKDSACAVFAYLTGDTFEAPKVLKTMEDISKIVEVIRFNTFYNKNNWCNPTDSIIIDYNGYFELSPAIYPKPDSISLSSLVYWNKEKIDYIFKHNLIFHANFPDMENIQEAKIFILSLLITMLIGLLGNIIYRMRIYKLWDYKYPSYILTLLVTFVIMFFCYIIVHNASVKARDVQEKLTKPYYNPSFPKRIE